MEKFRKFGDDATGNHPFLPHPSHEVKGLGKIFPYVTNQSNQTLGLVIAVLRLAILVLFSLVYQLLKLVSKLVVRLECGEPI